MTGKRKNTPPKQITLTWARSGGRCAWCGEDLTKGSFTGKGQLAGEVAHIVGQGRGPKSPRGAIEMSDQERASVGNLMLLCRGDHNDIDRKGSQDLATIEQLRTVKRNHEAWVARLMELQPERGTVVLRVVGQVDGATAHITKADARAAVIADLRYPDFPQALDYDGEGVDLRPALTRYDASQEEWRAACKLIDDAVDRLHAGIAAGAAPHVSVFALAPIPLLVYLGTRLDDAYRAEVYQFHRETQSWAWADDDEAHFETEWNGELGEDVALLLNVSGTVDPAQLPEELSTYPSVHLVLRDEVPAPGSVSSRKSLRAFEATARNLLAELEANGKTVRRLHVIGAMPVSVAVTLGRVRSAGVHPSFVTYARVGDGYMQALEIG